MTVCCLSLRPTATSNVVNQWRSQGFIVEVIGRGLEGVTLLKPLLLWGSWGFALRIFFLKYDV